MRSSSIKNSARFDGFGQPKSREENIAQLSEETGISVSDLRRLDTLFETTISGLEAMSSERITDNADLTFWVNIESDYFH